MDTGALGPHGEHVRSRAGMERVHVHESVRIRHQLMAGKLALGTTPMPNSVVSRVQVAVLIIPTKNYPEFDNEYKLSIVNLI